MRQNQTFTGIKSPNCADTISEIKKHDLVIMSENPLHSGAIVSALRGFKQGVKTGRGVSNLLLGKNNKISRGMSRLDNALDQLHL